MAESTPDFDKFYTDTLQPVLQQMEEMRIKAKNGQIAFYVFVVLAIISFFAITLSNGSPVAITFVVLFGLAAVIAAILYLPKRKKYVQNFKEKIVRQVISFVDPDCEYKPGDCIPEADYEGSGLFLQSAERYNGDDYVNGKYKQTAFCFSELHTEYKVQSGKSSHWETIFKGLFFMGDFNKNFSSRTYVWSERDPQLNFFNKLFSSFAHGLEKVTLESPEFEKKFIVYSSDQVDARYILSPSLMERMVELQDKFGSNVVFSFVNTNVNVAIPIKADLFEPSIFQAPDIRGMRSYYDTMLSVLGMIDILNLNLRIWNKE
ncbi:MAG: DUF3137 domain-containing protein [Bacteroidetes bacterium]|nr:DUF3137 domain-containing protein [Bacteroidota bacterium]